MLRGEVLHLPQGLSGTDITGSQRWPCNSSNPLHPRSNKLHMPRQRCGASACRLLPQNFISAPKPVGRGPGTSSLKRMVASVQRDCEQPVGRPYIYIRRDICKHIYIHARAYIYIYIYIRTYSSHTHVHTHTCMHTYMCADAYIYIYMYTHTFTHTHLHTHTDTHTDTRAHTHIHVTLLDAI